MEKIEGGKGSKIMASSDGSSVPLALHTESASPHEVSLVEATLASGFVKEKPERLIGDKAYDSDPLDEFLLEQGIEMLALHRNNRKKKKSQDGRKKTASLQLKMEHRESICLATELQEAYSSLRVQGYKDENFLGMAHLG